MFKLTILLASTLLLTACAPPESDIDKCTNAWVKVVDPPKENRAFVELQGRLECMKAASAKQN
jgi:hypothetical protein